MRRVGIGVICETAPMFVCLFVFSFGFDGFMIETAFTRNIFN